MAVSCAVGAAPVTASPSRGVTWISAASEVITIRIVRRVDLDFARVSITSARAAAIYVRRLGGGLEGGFAVVPELRTPTRFAVTPTGTRDLEVGTYDVAVLGGARIVARLPLPRDSVRIVARRAAGAPRTQVVELTAPGGAALGSWHGAVTVAPRTLVVAAVEVVSTTAAGAEYVDVCVGPTAVPCSAQPAYGASLVSSRAAPVEDSFVVSYVEIAGADGERHPQANVVGAEAGATARAVFFTAPLP